MKKAPKPFRTRFENTMRNPIFNFFFVDKTLKKNQQNYGPSHFKTPFEINFTREEVVKLKIKKYVFAYFQFDQFPKS